MFMFMRLPMIKSIKQILHIGSLVLLEYLPAQKNTINVV